MENENVLYSVQENEQGEEIEVGTNNERGIPSVDKVYGIFTTPNKFQAKTKKKQNRTPAHSQKRKSSQSPPSEDIQEDKRPRTPSGQVLQKTVETLKSAFESANKCGATKRNDASSEAYSEKQTVHDQKGKDANMSIDVDYPTFLKSHLPLMCEKTQTAPCDTVFDRVISDMDKNSEIQTEEPFGNPNVMDIRSVVEMLQQLKIEVKESVKGEIAADTTVMEIHKKLLECEFKERTMAQSITRLSDMVSELQEKNEILEANNAKKMLILSGLETDEKRKNARLQILSFLHDTVDAQVNVEDFYYIGNSTPRDIVLLFASISDKHEVKKNIKN